MSEAALPEGWVRTDVGSVGEYINGLAFKVSDWETTGRPIIRIQNLSNPTRPFNYTSRIHDERFVVKPGDILVSWSATLDAFRWRGPEAVLNQHIFKVIPNEALVEGSYLFWGLKHIVAQMWRSEHAHGSTMTHINRGPFLAHDFPLPPLAEQGRIVQKIESLVLRVDAARQRLLNTPTTLKRLRQSILAAAYSGRLTEDWRDANRTSITANPLIRVGAKQANDSPRDVSIPTEWAWATIASLCDPTRAITYGVIKLGPDVPDGIPTLRSSNVRPLFIQPSGIKRIGRAIADQYARTYLRGGEVLVTVRGTLGGVAVVPADMAGFNISREVAQLPLKAKLNPEYIMYAIASPPSQEWLADRAKGVAYTGINIEDLRVLPIPLPSLDEQQEIGRRTNALLALADAIEQRVAAATTCAEKMTETILAEAFRGELVPTEAALARNEKRDYESASSLLKRSRTQGAEQGRKADDVATGGFVTAK